MCACTGCLFPHIFWTTLVQVLGKQLKFEMLIFTKLPNSTSVETFQYRERSAEEIEKWEKAVAFSNVTFNNIFPLEKETRTW